MLTFWPNLMMSLWFISSWSFCCLWHHCPTTYLIFLFLISSSTTWCYFSFYSYILCPSSSLLCWIQVFPLILDSHQISVCFICIFIMWTQFGPKETSRSQKIYRNQSSVIQVRAGTRIHQCCRHEPITILPGTLVSKSFIYWLE